MKKTSQSILLDIDGNAIPTKIYWERRSNVRASIGKKQVNLRLPFQLTIKEQEEKIAWLKNWLQEKMAAHPDLVTRFVGKNYLHGDILQVGQRTYQLHIEHSDRKTHHARLKDGIIYLTLSLYDKEANLHKSIRKLLSRVVAQDFKPAITQRILDINQQYFKKPIRNVSLKYNLSNWGSCSSKNNINLSTRLLFAPDEVIDYVIIHELAHLIEMNHSNRFWKIVADIMPDYQEKEEWLKVNRGKCDF